MNRTPLVLALLLSALLIAGAGCGAAATGAAACQPVNNWGGPVFACGGSSGGSSVIATFLALGLLQSIYVQARLSSKRGIHSL